MVCIALRCAICLRGMFDGDIPIHRLRIMVCCPNNPQACFEQCSRAVLESVIESNYSGMVETEEPVLTPVLTIHNTFIGVVK